jgi:hypothetical protein
MLTDKQADRICVLLNARRNLFVHSHRPRVGAGTFFERDVMDSSDP